MNLDVKRNISKTLSMLLVLIMLAVSCLSLSVNAEQDNVYDEDGKMNLDVVFVLDASGSMLSSDPNKIAIDAFNLFVDLCDESCGVGYSVYTNKIIESSPIISLSDEKNLESLKENISEIQYEPHGSTDIALGLTEALKIHSKNESSDTTRKKAIILLSDGNTYLSNGSRPLSEASEEMEETLQLLYDDDIPVYSIGLNYDGKLDKEEIERISDGTNGKSYETTTSDELISIISDIFSDIYKLDGTNCEIKNGDVKINVKDSSVFYVNVIIKTNLTLEELNPVLTSPSGKEVSLTENDNIKMTNAGSYTLIKLIYPDIGTWNLHLDNADQSNCKITQLDFYSVYIKQNIKSSAVVGESIKIEASLNDVDGVVDDYDLLKTITMTTVVSSENGEINVNLIRETDGVYTGEFTADIEGNYTVKTIATSETFKKESAVAQISVALTAGSADENSESAQADVEGMAILTIILIVIGIAIVIAIIAIVVFAVIHAVVKSKTENMERIPDNRKVEQPPKRELPKQQPPKQKPVPKPPALKYVDIPLIEHGDLESLIKKGPDDAFSANPDDYKADPSLEALIKKGAEDPFKTTANDYQADPSLVGIIKSGGEGLEKKVSLEKDESSTDSEDYQTDSLPVNITKSEERLEKKVSLKKDELPTDDDSSY